MFLIQGVRAEIGERGQDISDICNVGRELLDKSVRPEKLNGKLRDLTDAWQELNDLARDRHLLLQNLLQVHLLNPITFIFWY